MSLEISPTISIPLNELNFRFDRSSGPGGQNVNKVNTKVTLWWDVTSSAALPEPVRERFIERYRRRLTNEGQIVVRSQRFRDQGRNVADCMEKLRQMVIEVLNPPRQRKATRPTHGSKLRRRESKEQRSQKKQRRKRPDRDW